MGYYNGFLLISKGSTYNDTDTEQLKEHHQQLNKPIS